MDKPVVWYSCVWMIGAYMGLFADKRQFWLAMVWLAALLVVLRVRDVLGNVQTLIAVAICIVSIGYNTWTDRSNASALSVDDGTVVTLQGTITSAVHMDGDRATFTLKGAPVRDLTSESIDRKSVSAERFRVTIKLASEAEKDIVRAWQRGMSATVDGTLSRPSAASNFDAFDYRTYLHRQRIHWLLDGSGAQAVEVAARSRLSHHKLLAIVDIMRERLAARLDLLFPGGYGGLMQSQLIGWKAELDPEQYDRFAHVGLAHVLAISGMHVAIFLGMLLFLFRLCGVARETGIVVSLILLPLYALLTGAAPPVIRASVMAMIGLEAARRQRLRDGLSIVSVCAWGMQAASPYLLASVSYQLSFMITLGLILFVKPMHDLLPALWAPVRSTIAVAITAQLISFPLTIYYFNHFSVLSFPANLVLVPILSLVVVPLGLVGLPLSYVHFTLGNLCAVAAEATLRFVFQAIEVMMRADPFGTIWPSPPEWWIAMYYIMFAVIIRSCLQLRTKLGRPLSQRQLARRKRTWMTMIATSFVVLCLALVYAYAPDRWDTRAVVSFLDVGQGDAILVRTPQKRHILIDAGGTLRFHKPGEEWKLRSDPYEVGKDLLVPLLKKRGVHRLDYLILTHGDADHIGGAFAVLNEIPVERIVFNGTLKRSQQMEDLFRLALELRIPLYTADRGRTITIDCCSDMLFLHPARERDGILFDEAQNGNSVVLLLRLYQRHFLLTGDLDAQGERHILSELSTSGWAKRMPRIDVMKAAHHGSKTSTSPLWLNAWRPEHTVISVGARNVYGHPHPSVLSRLNEADGLVWRTDLHGEVRFTIDQDTMKIDTKRSP